MIFPFSKKHAILLKTDQRTPMRLKQTILTLLFTASAAALLSGCAGGSYDAYDNRSYQDREIDNAAHEAAQDAANSLSAQDIKNINNLKK